LTQHETYNSNWRKDVNSTQGAASEVSRGHVARCWCLCWLFSNVDS